MWYRTGSTFCGVVWKAVQTTLMLWNLEKFVVTVFIGHWYGNCSHYVCGVCSTPICKACVKLEKNCCMFWKLFISKWLRSQLTPLDFRVYLEKNCTNFLWNVFVTYLMCAITKINKSQKISTCYVKYVLLILEKKQKRKGLIDLFGPFRVKMITNQRLSWLKRLKQVWFLVDQTKD